MQKPRYGLLGTEYPIFAFTGRFNVPGVVFRLPEESSGTVAGLEKSYEVAQA